MRIDNNKGGKVWFEDVKIVKGNSAKNTIVEEKNYYAFGLSHRGYNNVVSSNGNATARKFGFNGVELEESLGLNLHEMDFRQYDQAIVRFTGIDPVTHHSMSPYLAFDGNPVYWADPSGTDAVGADGLTNEEWVNESRDNSFKQNINNEKGAYDIAMNLYNETEKGGRSHSNFETRESLFLSAEKVKEIFDAIVQEMNMLLQESMWNEALQEYYKPESVYSEDYKKYKSLKTKTTHNLDHIDKMIGKKPFSTFWGSVELDEQNNVIKASKGTGGSIIINYSFGTGTISGFSMGRDKNGNPTGRNIWGMGQDTFTNSNPYGIKFTKNGRATSNWISFKTNEDRTKFWNFYKNLKNQFIEQFK